MHSLFSACRSTICSHDVVCCNSPREAPCQRYISVWPRSLALCQHAGFFRTNGSHNRTDLVLVSIVLNMTRYQYHVVVLTTPSLVLLGIDIMMRPSCLDSTVVSMTRHRYRPAASRLDNTIVSMTHHLHCVVTNSP
jgi:hypothetical protein